MAFGRWRLFAFALSGIMIFFAAICNAERGISCRCTVSGSSFFIYIFFLIVHFFSNLVLVVLVFLMCANSFNYTQVLNFLDFLIALLVN